MILETVTVLERLVVESIRTGAAVDGSIVPEGERLIRAELLLAAILDETPERIPGRIPALRVTSGLIIGAVDLSYATVSVPIRFVRCRFDGSLTARYSTLRNLSAQDCDIPAVDVEGATITSDIDLTESRIPGVVNMARAHVSGSVDLQKAEIGTDAGTALGGWGVRVDGNLMLRNGLSSKGEINLLDGRIGGVVELSGSTLSNRGGLAFDGSRLQIGGPMICREGLRVEGAFFLRRARVGGFVDFRGAQMSNPGGASLFAPVAEFDGGLTVSNTDFEGPISLAHARITGGADLSGAQIRTTQTTALVCTHLNASRLTLPETDEYTGAIDLTNARTTVVDARTDACHQLRLDGFSYDDLQPLLAAAERIPWLTAASAQRYRPQPYEQLAAAYRRVGHDIDARRVLLAKYQHQRAELRPAARIWGLLQDVTTGYGYRPARAGGWLLGLLAVGSIVFSFVPPLPLKDAPPFNAVFYTLDLLLPILSYGQESAYRPTGSYQWLAYLLVTAGWILATTLLAGITRVLSRT